MRKGLYPGSFDPITNGHLDVLQRAAKLFDELIVAVALDNQKASIFSVEERVALLEETVKLHQLENVRVVGFKGLLVEYAMQHQVTAVVRGLRAVSDFEFEFQMALMNRKLHPEVETIFLTPKEELTYISSRIVKEIARLGGEIEGFVPDNVALALRAKLNVPKK